MTEVLGAIREDIASKPVLNESDSKFLMSYGRFLSGVVRDRRIGNVGKFAGRSLEEMLEMAKGDPDIREALRQLGH